jgi:hypothetical protein
MCPSGPTSGRDHHGLVYWHAWPQHRVNSLGWAKFISFCHPSDRVAPHAVSRKQAQAARHAHNRMEASVDTGMFAYQTICDLLEINSGALRAALRKAIGAGPSNLRYAVGIAIDNWLRCRPHKAEFAA